MKNLLILISVLSMVIFSKEFTLVNESNFNILITPNGQNWNQFILSPNSERNVNVDDKETGIYLFSHINSVFFGVIDAGSLLLISQNKRTIKFKNRQISNEISIKRSDSKTLSLNFILQLKRNFKLYKDSKTIKGAFAPSYDQMNLDTKYFHVSETLDNELTAILINDLYDCKAGNAWIFKVLDNNQHSIESTSKGCDLLLSDLNLY